MNDKKSKTKQLPIRLSETDRLQMEKDTEQAGLKFISTYMVQLWKLYREDFAKKFAKG